MEHGYRDMFDTPFDPQASTTMQTVRFFLVCQRALCSVHTSYDGSSNRTSLLDLIVLVVNTIQYFVPSVTDPWCGFQLILVARALP
jgi:hypothetical protein